MMKLKPWHKWITICTFILGILMMVQFRTQDSINRSSSTNRLEDIAATLIQVSKATQQLASEADSLKNTLSQYQDGENIRSIISAEIVESKVSAGLVPMVGPGVVITLGDSMMPRDWDADYYYIHDWYIRDLVNLLWIGGADVISINDQRVITTTEVFCGGTTIFINKKLIPPPYIIRAIGDSNTLTNSLKMGTIVPILEDMKKTFAITFTIEQEDMITVPGYTEDIVFKYLKIAQD
jgi:uncharacterized protein YlxW (UPF0749 family)